MKKIVIYPYKMSSVSGYALSAGLACKRVYPDRKYRPKKNDLIVNWGNSKNPKWVKGMLNNPAFVANAINKLKTFEILKLGGVSTPEFTTDIEVAKTWETIVERHTLTGSQGSGIKISTPETIQTAPLYSKYVKPDREYRVHVFNGKVIDYALKRKREGVETSMIKNHANGYIFSRRYDKRRDDIMDVAVRAVGALGLDFGAVDIVRSKDSVYVLEVNTSPGVEGTTLISYINAIKEYAEQN